MQASRVQNEEECRKQKVEEERRIGELEASLSVMQSELGRYTINHNYQDDLEKTSVNR